MKNRILLFVATVLCAFSMMAQSRSALKITEVMVQNDSCIVDEYGAHNGWIELFNSNFGPLDISSVYLTTDTANKKMYPVPLGDLKTKIGKRQSVVFFADGFKDRGTFHTNFKLVPGQDNFVAVYDADGITLIDSVTVPASLQANNSWALNSETNTWEVRDGSADKYITPGAPNKTKDSNNKVEKFAEKDPHGFAMAAMAMCIVFSALLILAIAFYVISKIGAAISRQNKAKAQGVETETYTAREVQHDSGEEIAAIVMAMHEHFNAHDKESTVLTINKVKRAYSPWSSKIYGMRVLPGKNLH